ncbi:hypothetical protein LIER_34327 [Lithospermum erythrorhizon]|uniref:Uncharacterized protein n=1 Tax=Lithospermum erythrorhizon TaxID=34254 RepID=A0AAV3S2P7_LITER
MKMLANKYLLLRRSLKVPRKERKETNEKEQRNPERRVPPKPEKDYGPLLINVYQFPWKEVEDDHVEDQVNPEQETSNVPIGDFRCTVSALRIYILNDPTVAS